MKSLVEKVAGLHGMCFSALDGRRGLVMAAMRFAVGWHLAYLGVWALTSSWDYSWAGCFRCARWLLGGVLRTVGNSAAMGAVDFCLAWGLLLAGVLLMLGRLVRPAAVFGLLYLALMYLLNPPHFGHTGESHFMYIDRNLVEACMLLCVISWRGKGAGRGAGDRRDKEDTEVV